MKRPRIAPGAFVLRLPPLSQVDRALGLMELALPVVALLVTSPLHDAPDALSIIAALGISACVDCHQGCLSMGRATQLGQAASFTAWQTRAWIVLIVEANTPVALAGHILIWIASGVCGIIAAKFGELLLFGTSRKR